MTEADALAKAQAAAEAKGLPWQPPTIARRSGGWFGPKRWRVTSNAGMRGSNVVVVLEDASGAVLEVRALPR